MGYEMINLDRAGSVGGVTIAYRTERFHLLRSEEIRLDVLVAQVNLV